MKKETYIWLGLGLFSGIGAWNFSKDIISITKYNHKGTIAALGRNALQLTIALGAADRMLKSTKFLGKGILERKDDKNGKEPDEKE